MQATPASQKIIKLNVGGKIFSTTKDTLCAEPESMLAVMFSGRYSVEHDENGCVFIDRSGEWFAFILEYLRTKSISPHLSPNELYHLRKEAEYFQMTGILQILDKMATESKARSQLLDREFTLQVWTVEKPEDCTEAVATLCRDGYTLENFQYVSHFRQTDGTTRLKFVGFFSKKREPHHNISVRPTVVQ